MSKVRLLLLLNFMILGFSYPLWLSSSKSDADRVSLQFYKGCFDNFSAHLFCDLLDGSLLEPEAVQADDVVIIGDSHALVFAELVRRSSVTKKFAGKHRFLFSGISSCLPSVDYVHELRERRATCHQLAVSVRDRSFRLVLAAKWNKYSRQMDVESDVLCISQAPLFSLPPSAVPDVRSRWLRIALSDYLSQSGSIPDGCSVFNPYLDAFCSDSFCSQIDAKAQHFYYSDANHLSNFGIARVLTTFDLSLFVRLLGIGA